MRASRLRISPGNYLLFMTKFFDSLLNKKQIGEIFKNGSLIKLITDEKFTILNV